MAATNLVQDLRGFFRYENRLRKLGLTTLKVRRERGDMIETYKIMTGKENIDRNQFFHLADSKYNLRGHDMRIDKARFRLDIRKFSFNQRVINEWNRLPRNVVQAKSVNGKSFQRRTPVMANAYGAATANVL